MTDKKQESKYTKLSKQEFTMSPISIPFTLTQSYNETVGQSLQNSSSNTTDGFKTFSLKLNSYTIADASAQLEDLNTLFDSWKNKTEQFVLLMEIRHNNCGFSWCDPALLSQNPEILGKLDFMKEEKPIKQKYFKQRYVKISTNEEFGFVCESTNTAPFSKPNALKRNINLKNRLKRSVSKTNTIKTSLKHQTNKKSRINIQNSHQSQNKPKSIRLEKNTNTKKQNDLNTSSFPNQSNQTKSLVNNPMNDLIRFNDHPDDLIYNLQMINNTSNSTQNLPTPNELINNQGVNLNANCTYYNFMPMSYTPVNYYQQADISVPVMIESNVESSDFSELLNCLRGENEISIENDNMFIFSSKY